MEGVIGEMNEQSRIADSNLSPENKIKYLKCLTKAKKTFTERKIAVQYIQNNADLKDALRIFSTVNQAGVKLADPDFIQAIITSIYPEFHSRIYEEFEKLQKVQVGINNDNEPIFSKLGGFKRDVILKVLLWELYGTTKRKDGIVNSNLEIYNPRYLKHKLKKEWKDMDDDEKNEVTEPLTKSKISEIFENVINASKAFKRRLENDLFFRTTEGHSDNSILGGIIFHMNNTAPTDHEIGQLLCWYILSSYHKEWTGGSTDIKVNNTCKYFSNKTGVLWDELWKQMQQESQIEKKSEYSGEIQDLYPKIDQKEFPGIQSESSGQATGIIIQLLEKFRDLSHEE